MGVPPIAGWFIMEYSIKMDDEQGYPYSRKPQYGQYILVIIYQYIIFTWSKRDCCWLKLFISHVNWWISPHIAPLFCETPRRHPLNKAALVSMQDLGLILPKAKHWWPMQHIDLHIYIYIIIYIYNFISIILYIYIYVHMYIYMYVYIYVYT